MSASVYIESSIISYLTSRPSRDVVKAGRQAVTSEWWLEHKGRYEVYISALVEDEISGGDPVAAAQRLQAVGNIASVVITLEAQALADALVASKAVPANSARDALHIAIAATQGADYLLTWNFKHINNAETKLSSHVLSKPAAWSVQSCAHPKNLEVTAMENDPIVDEVRNNGLAFAARHNNDVAAMCKALKEREKSSGRKLVNRQPRRLVRDVAS